MLLSCTNTWPWDAVPTPRSQHPQLHQCQGQSTQLGQVRFKPHPKATFPSPCRHRVPSLCVFAPNPSSQQCGESGCQQLPKNALLPATCKQQPSASGAGANKQILVNKHSPRSRCCGGSHDFKLPSLPFHQAERPRRAQHPRATAAGRQDRGPLCQRGFPCGPSRNQVCFQSIPGEGDLLQQQEKQNVPQLPFWTAGGTANQKPPQKKNETLRAPRERHSTPQSGACFSSPQAHAGFCRASLPFTQARLLKTRREPSASTK